MEFIWSKVNYTTTMGTILGLQFNFRFRNRNFFSVKLTWNCLFGKYSTNRFITCRWQTSYRRTSITYIAKIDKIGEHRIGEHWLITSANIASANIHYISENLLHRQTSHRRKSITLANIGTSVRGPKLFWLRDKYYSV